MTSRALRRTRIRLLYSYYAHIIVIPPESMIEAVLTRVKWVFLKQSIRLFRSLKAFRWVTVPYVGSKYPPLLTMSNFWGFKEFQFLNTISHTLQLTVVVSIVDRKRCLWITARKWWFVYIFKDPDWLLLFQGSQSLNLFQVNYRLIVLNGIVRFKASIFKIQHHRNPYLHGKQSLIIISIHG